MWRRGQAPSTTRLLAVYRNACHGFTATAGLRELPLTSSELIKRRFHVAKAAVVELKTPQAGEPKPETKPPGGPKEPEGPSPSQRLLSFAIHPFLSFLNGLGSHLILLINALTWLFRRPFRLR